VKHFVVPCTAILYFKFLPLTTKVELRQSIKWWNKSVFKYHKMLYYLIIKIWITWNYIWTGGRAKVDFFKVDKRFWRVDLGRNWAMSSMLTHFDFVIYVDMDWYAVGRHKSRELDFILDCKLIFAPSRVRDGDECPRQG